MPKREYNDNVFFFWKFAWKEVSNYDVDEDHVDRDSRRFEAEGREIAFGELRC